MIQTRAITEFTECDKYHHPHIVTG